LSHSGPELSAPVTFPHPAIEDGELVKKKFGTLLGKKNRFDC
jgi:hypothetical protein